MRGRACQAGGRPIAMTVERVHVYEILEPASRGGPGRALRARVADTAGPLPVGTIVQVRVITEAEAGGADVVQELVREHAAARKITAEGVCAPLDFGVSVGPEGRRFWSACRWAEGRTLTDVLAGVEALPDPFVDSIAKQVAQAMEAVHAAGLSVIGLSTDTILVQDDASATVLDVALGAAQKASWPTSGATTPSLACAAPEAIRSRAKADGSADLYALGAALFRAMTGRRHRPDDAQALTCEPESFRAVRPSEVHPRQSLFLDELVFALLDPDPAKRIGSFQALLKILDERRESAWWHSLNIAQDSYHPDKSARDRAPSDHKPPPIPSPAPPPDEAWVAERRARSPGIGRHAAPLVGRQEELAGLVDAAGRLRERGGQVRLLQGSGGSGRTRLVDAALDALRAQGEAPIVLFGGHRRLGIGRPMRAFSEAFTRLLAEDREVDAGQVAPLLGDAAAVAPAFAAFLSGREPPEKTTSLTRDAIAEAFSRSLTTLCGASPVVFVVENLQWADPEGLDLFAQVARLAKSLPLLLIGTFEPVARATPLARTLSTLRSLDHVATVKVDALSEAETLQLVCSLVTTDENAVALARRVHAASGGMPLRIVETLRLLDGEGVLFHEGERLRADERAPAAPLPDSERAIWERRIALLGAPERAMLTMAVVQGFAFDAQVARLALNLDAGEAERALDRLAAASRTTRCSTTSTTRSRTRPSRRATPPRPTPSSRAGTPTACRPRRPSGSSATAWRGTTCSPASPRADCSTWSRRCATCAPPGAWATRSAWRTSRRGRCRSTRRSPAR
jgi:serine/threonine protein kinase